jgi:hypothetical protein
VSFSAEQIVARFERSVTRRRNWQTLWQDVYDLCLPGRGSFFTTTAGTEKTDDIFDDTGALALQEFANLMVEGMLPRSSDIFALLPSSRLDERTQEELRPDLRDITAFIHEVLRKSDFFENAHESFVDVAIGTGCLTANDSRDATYVKFESWPLDTFSVDVGPKGTIDGTFRWRQDVRIEDIKVVWPKAVIPQALLDRQRNNQMEIDQKPTFIEFTVRLWTEGEEVYQHGIVWKEEQTFLLDTELRGQGSRPQIPFRWTRAPGEWYGRGPALLALPSIKTTNLTVQLILENAEMQIGGIWKAENDGVTNYDTIQLVPNTVLTYMPGQRGLEPLSPPGNPDFANLVLNDMRANIREALFNETFEGRGDTPISASEVAARQLRLARRIGSPIGRIFNELIRPTVLRVIFLLKQQGILEMPVVDGREIDIIPTSPLARAQRNEDILQIQNFATTVTQLLGDSARLYLDPAPMVRDLAVLFEQPPEYLVSERQRNQMRENAAGAQAAQIQGSSNVSKLLP